MPVRSGGTGPDRGLAAAALRGSTWLLFSAAATSGLQLVSAAVLGRLLPPQDFGVVAAAMLLLRVVYYFSQFGIGSAVVQKPVLTDDDIRTSAWLAIVVGGGAALVGVSAAPLLGALFHQPESVAVARALSLTFLLVGVGTTPLALLRRQLRFRAIAAVEVVSYGVGYLLVGLVAAAAGAGLWSLVIAALIQASVQTVAACLLARHPVALLPRRASLGPIARFGGQVSVVGLLEFWTLQTDSIGVARRGDASDLGQYTRGTIIAYPVIQVALVVSRVLLSAFARMTDLVRLRVAYSDALVLLSTGSAVVAAVLAGGHTVVVSSLLGPQWHAAAELLPWFAMASALQALSQLPAVLCEARAVLRPKMVIQLVVLAVLVLSVGSAIVFSGPLWTFAAGWVAGEVVRQLLYLAVVSRRFGIAIGATVRDLGHAVLLGVLTGVAVAGADGGLAAVDAPLPVRLAAVLLVGVWCPGAVLACWPGAPVRGVIRRRGLLHPLPDGGRLRRLLERTIG